MPPFFHSTSAMPHSIISLPDQIPRRYTGSVPDLNIGGILPPAAAAPAAMSSPSCGAIRRRSCKNTGLVAVRQQDSNLSRIPAALIRCFLPCCPGLASARRRPPRQKSLEHCSPECAGQFFRSGFLARSGSGRRESCRISKGGDAVWTEIRPKKTGTGSSPAAL